MDNIYNEIEKLEKRLGHLKINVQQSFESVKVAREGSYGDKGFEDTCTQIIHLLKGNAYEKYKFNRTGEKVDRSEYWIKGESGWGHKNYCNIYTEELSGSPIGFICPQEGLFEATENFHKQLWISAIKNAKETRSFEQYVENLKTDDAYLVKAFNKHYWNIERRTGSCTIPQLETFENEELEIKKHYIFYF